MMYSSSAPRPTLSPRQSSRAGRGTSTRVCRPSAVFGALRSHAPCAEAESAGAQQHRMPYVRLRTYTRTAHTSRLCVGAKEAGRQQRRLPAACHPPSFSRYVDRRAAVGDANRPSSTIYNDPPRSNDASASSTTMARSSRVSQAAGQITPEEVAKAERATSVPPRGTSASRTSSVQSVSRRIVGANGTEEVELLDSQEATRRANEAQENVFLFVPNLIGYTRIVLAALSLYYMKSQPKTCTLLYGVSCLLDAADGVAARRLGQATKFGAVLDMVTDRCTTACLLCFLTAAYPRCAILFQGLITLDFSSHYIHMYSSLITGSSSHKLVTSDVSWILWYYYNDSRTLFFYCAGNELFFVCLYLMDFYKTALGLQPEWFLWPLGKGVADSLLKSAEANKDSILALTFQLIRKLTWPQIVGAITLPICFVKQVINAVQFWKAAKVLVGIDLAEREKKRSQKK